MDELDTLPDAALVARMRHGSEAAFTAVYRRHQRPLHRFAFRMGAAAADEIVQEVFLEFLRHPSRWSPQQGTLAAFLHGIARNKLLRLYDKERRFLDPSSEDSSAPALDPDILSTLVLDERAALLHQAVLSLPVLYREAIFLCDIEELSYEDAAERIGCPVGTVRSRLRRARALVAGKLKIKMGCVL
jgi:RNA polymerase sigma-70 factor (ECF subfamily)